MSAHVAVVVPARNEAHGIGRTLASVQASLAHAHRWGVIQGASIDVAAHRCTDATVAVARRALGPVGGHVAEDHRDCSVGMVRDRAARHALARLAGTPARTWLLSTDADTRVPLDWVAQILTAAGDSGSVGVVGLAQLDRWRGSDRAAAAYRHLLASKLHADHGDHQHGHVYGANLAVQAQAYLDVGGFPDVRLGEDQALVDNLVAGGHRVLRTRAIRVVTSGRTRGRAVGGLAHRLARLEDDAREVVAGS